MNITRCPTMFCMGYGEGRSVNEVTELLRDYAAVNHKDRSSQTKAETKRKYRLKNKSENQEQPG